MVLSNLTQSGGTLGDAGSTVLDRLTQTGGSIALTQDLNVSLDFNQSGSGSVSVGGNTQITDTAGGVQLGNLTSTGTLNVNSTDGAIVQSAGSTITAQNTSNFGATRNGVPADITLDNPGNDLQGVVSLNGGDVAIADSNALTLGVVTTTGDLTVHSNGALDLGTSSVGGNLNADSTNGNITQTGALTVAKAATLNAGTGAIALTNASNDLQGVVSLNGGDVAIADSNALTLGVVTTTGDLTVHSNGALDLGTSSVGGNLNADSTNGNITQTGALTVAKAATLNAGTGAIALTNASNDLQGVVSLNGGDVAIADANALTLGVVTTTGDLSVHSNGALDLGTSSVGGNLNANSGNGNITQTGALTVAKAATLNAGTGTVALTNAGNNMVKGVTVTAGVSNVVGDQVAVARSTAASAAVGVVTVAVAVRSDLIAQTAPTPLVFDSVQKNGAGVLVELLSRPEGQVADWVAVSLPKTTIASGVGFTFALPTSVTESIPLQTTVRATMPNGGPLPSWLAFDAKTMAFTTLAIPDGALPMRVLVAAGARQVMVTISERGE
jgi:hypothetical protein